MGLGRIQIAVDKECGRGHDLGRKGAQRRHLAAALRIVVAARSCGRGPSSMRPATRQRVIEVHRRQEGLDGLAVLGASSTKQRPRSSCRRLKRGWCCSRAARVRMASGIRCTIALRHRHTQQCIAMARRLRQQPRTRGQHFGELVLAQQRAVRATSGPFGAAVLVASVTCMGTETKGGPVQARPDSTAPAPPWSRYQSAGQNL